MKVDNQYAAFLLIEILYEKGIINKATYNIVVKYKKTHCDGADSHISQVA